MSLLGVKISWRIIFSILGQVPYLSLNIFFWKKPTFPRCRASADVPFKVNSAGCLPWGVRAVPAVSRCVPLSPPCPAAVPWVWDERRGCRGSAGSADPWKGSAVEQGWPLRKAPPQDAGRGGTRWERLLLLTLLRAGVKPTLRGGLALAAAVPLSVGEFFK